jgi:hypothetical protein
MHTVSMAGIGCLLACSSQASSPSPDAGGSSTGGVEVMVDQASSPPTVAMQQPQQGTTFVAISLTLRNTSSTAPIPSVPTLFSLETDHHLVLTVAPELYALPMACTGSASLAEGGSLSCGVLFDVAASETPMTLRYDDMQGHRATAPVPPVPPPPDVCVVVAGYKNLTSSTCTSCYQLSCNTELQAVVQACAGMTCSQCAGMSPTDGCACAHACDSAACWSAGEAIDECVEDHCMTSCM